jgi:NAD(P)-dependent dehydrogenase (short-subunit alcohol dehydrogenase family)
MRMSTWLTSDVRCCVSFDIALNSQVIQLRGRRPRIRPRRGLPGNDFRRQFETNFFGVYNVTRAALPVLRKQRAGHIVQISSVGGRVGTPGVGSYQAAKWSVGGFSEVLAKEVEPLGIHVTVIEPGGMRTDWAGSSMRIDDVRPEYQATVGALTRLRDAGAFRGDPAKVAELVVRVVSSQAPPLHLLAGSDMRKC